MLYEQCRDSITKEEYPVTRKVAAELAGIQACILSGFYDAEKHSTNFKLDLKAMFPEVFLKNNKKSIEKEIRNEWSGISDECKSKPLDIHGLKLRYVRICRNLKTYGITCFLVKEKEKGKNRMIPRLLGISKTAVYRLDNDTKEILKEWPLESIQRWAAGPKNATLDFGEYQEEPYAVKTNEGEGEKIVQLISGYIDIIMENRKKGDKFDHPGQEGAICEVYSNNPKKAQKVQINGGSAATPLNVVNPAVPGVIHHNIQAQRAQTGEINTEMAIKRSNPRTDKPLRPHLIPFQTTIKDNIDQLNGVKAHALYKINWITS